MTDRERSPWLYIGLGCLFAVILAVGSCVAIGWFGIQKAKEMGEEMTDPAKREAKVLTVLGAEELPPGYHPVMAISMPLDVMEMAMVSDEPAELEENGHSDPRETPGFGESGFMYIEQRELGASNEELSAYLRGESQDRGPLDNIQTNIRVDEREVLDRGELSIAGVSYLWSAFRGDIDDGDGDHDKILAVFQALCPEKPARIHVGIWWVPVGGQSASGPTERREDGTAGPQDTPTDRDQLDLAGTPADPEALQQFVAYFDLCR